MRYSPKCFLGLNISVAQYHLPVDKRSKKVTSCNHMIDPFFQSLLNFITNHMAFICLSTWLKQDSDNFFLYIIKL